MTYCLAMRLDEGLIFLADTRTNAGVDNVGTYRKLHVLQPAPDRVFVVESAGSLATTQEVLDRIDRDLATGVPENLATVSYLFEAALYVGRLNRTVTAEHVAPVGSGAAATFILGGQVAGERPDTKLVYTEGNYIDVSDTVPFLPRPANQAGRRAPRTMVMKRICSSGLSLNDPVKVEVSVVEPCLRMPLIAVEAAVARCA